jgi:hypothetical protein
MTITPRKEKTTAIVLFVFALLLWGATITHDMLGFVAPTSAQAVGFDIWTVLMWWLFLYAGRRLYRAFWKKKPSGDEHVQTV